MSKIEIDFNSIKYNLYEILNISQDADDTKIKKSFVKIIKNFHPDKNSELEEDIYYHIILANQVLLNKESRIKYDKFIDDNVDTYCELKEKFNKSIKNIDETVPDKGTSLNLFNYKINELNKKHGYDNNLDNISITERFNKAKEKRAPGVNEIKIENGV